MTIVLALLKDIVHGPAYKNPLHPLRGVIPPFLGVTKALHPVTNTVTIGDGIIVDSIHIGDFMGQNSVTRNDGIIGSNIRLADIHQVRDGVVFRDGTNETCTPLRSGRIFRISEVAQNGGVYPSAIGQN